MRKKQKAQSAINIVQLQNYNSPDIKVDKKNDWVTFGQNNSYFNYLIDRYTGSTTNNAVINGISQMIYGKGLDATDANRYPEEYAKAITMFHKDCVRKLAYDLKLFGQCAIQVIYSKDRKSVAQIEHMPVETLAMEKCDDNGEINGFFYFSDWSKIKPNDKPQRIPAFGTSSEPVEILYVRPYVAGHFYFSAPDYMGGLPYAELEEEIANYHLNNILNGLAPSMLINFSNGVPSEEERQMIEKRILEKYSGSSNAGRFILSFNENKETESSIEAIQLSDAHNQYQFLSSESSSKILTSHRVVSSMLFGIKEATGFSNNADELKTAATLIDNLTIRPFQNLLIDAFDKILAHNGITLNLYFKTLQPLEFTEINEEIVDEETIEEETGVKQEELSNEQIELSDDDFNVMLESLQPDELGDEWEFVDKKHVDDDMISEQDWATICIEPKETLFTKLSDKLVPKNTRKNENTFSYLDKSFYRVRYRYIVGTSKENKSGKSRHFCEAMIKRKGSNGKAAVYRIEDIDTASKSGVNKKFGHKGKEYDLFRWKGGPYCRHIWEAVLYRLKDKTKPSKYLRNYQETGSIPQTYMPTPYGHKDAKKAPTDMDKGGHHPNWKK